MGPIPKTGDSKNNHGNASDIIAIALTFSGVKWNPSNGKMAGLGAFFCAGYTVFSTFQADANNFVPRIFYVYAALIFLGGVHIFFFPSNPALSKCTSGSGKKKTSKRA